MALKWADGNGGRKDVLSLPTASSDVKGGIKVGRNLYMAAESLNADPLGGVNFGGGLYFDNGALTFNPLEGLPIGGGLSFVGGSLTAMPVPIGSGLYYDNGTLNAAPAAYWCASMADFPEMPQAGCIAIAGDKPYFYDGSKWVPFCQCSQGGDSGSSDPPIIDPETPIAPQISTRTVPCTLTLHYPFVYDVNDTFKPWTWAYNSEGWTDIVLPEYVTSRNQITITGANGEIIEPLTPEEVEAKATEDGISDDDRFTYENSFIYWYDSPYSYLSIVESPTGDLATQLRWNHWVNDGNQYSMQINISFPIEIKTVTAGYSTGGGNYCVAPATDGEEGYYVGYEETEASGTVVNVQGATYRDTGSGTLYFNEKPTSVALEFFDPQGVWELGGLSVNWAELSGATGIHLDTGGYPEIIRPQHFTDAANHSSALVVDLPFTNSTTHDNCGNGWAEIDNNNDSRYSPAIENGTLVLYQDCGVSRVGGITLGGQDFTIDGIYIGCQITEPQQRIFSLQTAADVQNKTYSIALVVDKGQMGVRMLFTGATNFSGNNGATRQYWHHFALVYQHEQSKVTLYIDGVQAQTATATLPATAFSKFIIGDSPSVLYSAIVIGQYSHFRVFNGVAVWTDNFVIDVNTVDSLIGGVWRYVNAGTADLLTVSGTTLTNLASTYSRTSTAFRQTNSQKCFDIPATSEVWMKFDVYFDGTNRWRAYNTGSADSCGVCSYVNYSGGDFGMWQNGNRIQDFSGVCKKNQLQTVLLHMVSGATAGVIEAWVDGALIYSYTGDVNHGEDFADIYLQSDGGNTFFSNVIVSSGRIGLSENLPFVEVLPDNAATANADKLIVNMPFNTSTTEDLSGGTWTAYNAPTISASAILFDTSGQYLELDGGLTLGGQDFTIAFKFNMSSTSGNWCKIFSLHKAMETNQNCIDIGRVNDSNQQLRIICNGSDASFNCAAVNTWHYVEMDYDYTAKKLYTFLDGLLVATISKTIAETVFDYLWLARPNYSSNGYFLGSIKEFKIYNNVALHTNNFVP